MERSHVEMDVVWPRAGRRVVRRRASHDLELLQRGAHVSEALQVQRELERITCTIEQLRGQLNLMQHQVSMSTIDLTLEKPTRPGPLGWIFFGLYHAIRRLFVWS